ncbi:hypothetical protein EV368DRAFT_85590 [Lentinula lateritia]|nr:hypothetical protein EV368DRAFT_85590 [Lentinula lateritia]
MSVTAREVWYDYEYHRGMYTHVLERFELHPRDPNVAYELVWAYSMADARPIPPGAEPPTAFPLECYDVLVLLPPGTLSSLPSIAVSTAIGWTPGLSHKFALEQERPVVLFEEGDGETESRVVVYLGGYQYVLAISSYRSALTRCNRFFSFATLIHQQVPICVISIISYTLYPTIHSGACIMEREDTYGEREKMPK